MFTIITAEKKENTRIKIHSRSLGYEVDENSVIKYPNPVVARTTRRVVASKPLRHTNHVFEIPLKYIRFEGQFRVMMFY